MITQKYFSNNPSDGILIFTLTNSQGMMMKVTNLGGIITELHVPDKFGKFDDVVLGFNTYKDYQQDHPFFGALVGRVAGRLSKARYQDKDREVQLQANDDPNHLHGGSEGFDKKVWNALTKKTPEGEQLILSLHSPNGDQGYPGNLDVQVIYQLTESNALKISYSATCDQSTPLSMTQHSYFNLAGESSSTILDHHFQILADYFTSGDEIMTLSGKSEPVQDRPEDLRQPKALRKVIHQLHKEHGDLYWTEPQTHNLKNVANVFEPISGRYMTVFSTTPCLQFYTGRYISDQWIGKSGKPYSNLSGFCLECQKYPDPDGIEGYGTNWLHPHQEYSETTIYQFSTRS